MLFREKQLQLQSKLPVCPKVRGFDIFISTDLSVKWLFSNSEKFTHSATQRHCPFVITSFTSIYYSYSSNLISGRTELVLKFSNKCSHHRIVRGHAPEFIYLTGWQGFSIVTSIAKGRKGRYLASNDALGKGNNDGSVDICISPDELHSL